MSSKWLCICYCYCICYCICCCCCLFFVLSWELYPHSQAVSDVHPGLEFKTLIRQFEDEKYKCYDCTKDVGQGWQLLFFFFLFFFSLSLCLNTFFTVFRWFDGVFECFYCHLFAKNNSQSLLCFYCFFLIVVVVPVR